MTPGVQYSKLGIVRCDFELTILKRKKRPKAKKPLGVILYNGSELFKKFDSDYNVFLRVGAGLNPTVLLALILMASPVCGFRPVLAFRERTVKVPNPG